MVIDKTRGRLWAKALRLLRILSAIIVVLSLGRLMYHYVLFQGTIRALTAF
jgi:hypothetical protein